MKIIAGRKYQHTNPWRVVTVASPYAGPQGMVLIETEDGQQEYVPLGELREISEPTHKVGDRVLVLHNIMLGNLIGTVSSVHDYGKTVCYAVELDGGGTDLLFGFQLQPLPESEWADIEAIGEQGRRDYLERAHAGETTEDDVELYGHGEEDESERDADEKADEKPDGQ